MVQVPQRPFGEGVLPGNAATTIMSSFIYMYIFFRDRCGNARTREKGVKFTLNEKKSIFRGSTRLEGIFSCRSTRLGVFF